MSDADANGILRELNELADASIAEHAKRYFKVGPGDYGDGDVFIGVKMPVLRKLAKQHQDCALTEVLHVLKSEVHEARMLALLVLVTKFSKADKSIQSEIYQLYGSHTRYINNWDLVDCSALHIVGAWLYERDRKPLYDWARSENLWERRIAMISTFYFIRKNQYDDTVAIAELLLEDEQDLIHKVVGWMLREVGKRDHATEHAFLIKHYKIMPRTMLRYAIEKFPEPSRQAFLKGTA